MNGADAAIVRMRETRELHPGVLSALLAVLVAMLAVISLGVGSAPLPFAAALRDLVGGVPSLDAVILWELRLPRTLLAILVGGSLGLCGAALQGLLRNPLAEPGIVGAAGAAAFGAVVMFYSGIAASFALALPLGGIAGALGAVALLYGLAGPRASVLTVILAGVAINSLAGALTSLALNLSSSPFAAYEIMFWLMGSLADRSFVHIGLIAPLMGLGWALVLASARGLDALTLGEDAARSLGINLRALQMQVIVGTALAIGAAVSVAGVIGFVGLVVPHLVRPLVGYRPAASLVASGFGGAALLLAADIALRVFDLGPELKLGVVTALIGAPFFLWLVLRLRGVEAA